MAKGICKLVATFCLVISATTGQYAQGLVTRSRPGNFRVIDGDEFIGHDYDFIVLLASIHAEEVHRQCTASVISKQWVLTAAHCLESYLKPPSLDFLFVWFKNFTISPLKSKYYAKVLELFIHPHYVFSYNNNLIELNDIALVRVNDVQMENYGKLLATDYQAILGREVTYVGGGQVEKHHEFSPEDELRPLQYFKGIVMICEKSYLEKISYPLICVAPRCKKKTQMGWYGDSGGPLLLDRKIIGVLVTITPTVVTAYVPISPYLHWILNVIDPQRNALDSKNNTRI